ncbi:MAG TPA: hypothetical protein VFP45_03790 [Candidatus Nitrosotalea sp.]|nr:hypothetical protein [Candidatus Nitrosotalea sp.]
MTQALLDMKGTPTLSEVFTQHISDISLEVEAIKLRNLRKDADGIEEHLARIESALSGIMEAKLAIAERLVHSRE